MRKTSYMACIDTAVGKLALKSTEEALTAIRFVDDERALSTQELMPTILEKANRQLQQYFSGDRETFDLPLCPSGTAFEQEVWQELANIPFGSSISYKRLAEKLGDARKVRAVGRANGQNPLPIIIPCHRVIGANNKLTGYAGGIERKRWLLKHEGVLLL